MTVCGHMSTCVNNNTSPSPSLQERSHARPVRPVWKETNLRRPPAPPRPPPAHQYLYPGRRPSTTHRPRNSQAPSWRSRFPYRGTISLRNIQRSWPTNWPMKSVWSLRARPRPRLPARIQALRMGRVAPRQRRRCSLFYIYKMKYDSVKVLTVVYSLIC